MTKGIILIHGYLVGPDDWDRLLPTLEKLGYSGVHSLTLAGHACKGEGDTLDYSQFTADNCLQKVLSDVNEIAGKYDSVDIIGHSLGGLLALKLATAFNFGKIVALAPALDIIPINWRTTLQAKRRAKAWEKKLRSLAVCDHYEHLKFGAAYKDYRQSNAKIIERTGQYVTPSTLGALTEIISRARDIDYSSTSGETLVVWGGFDEAIPRKCIKGLNKAVKNNARYKSIILEYYGHNFMHASELDELIEVIENFLQGEKANEN